LLLDSSDGTKDSLLQTGLKRRLSENGSDRFFRGMKWRGIVTPVK